MYVCVYTYAVLLGALPIPQPIIISRADTDPLSGGVACADRDPGREKLAHELMELSEAVRTHSATHCNTRNTLQHGITCTPPHGPL